MISWRTILAEGDEILAQSNVEKTLLRRGLFSFIKHTTAVDSPFIHQNVASELVLVQ